MIRKALPIFLFFLLVTLMAALAPSSQAFTGAGCAEDCTSCHTLDIDEANKLLKTEKFGAKVTGVKMSPIKGLWDVTIEKNGKEMAAYVDFAKQFLVEGRFTPLENIGKQPEAKKLDTSTIPLADAVVMGDPNAALKVIVFDDPDCPYCKKLHNEIKTIISKRKDIAFYIKLYPLAMHPAAYAKSKAIVCERSVKLLDDAFNGVELPKPECDTDDVDKTITLAKSLGINGTPGIVLPNGTLIPGYVVADTLIKMIDENTK